MRRLPPLLIVLVVSAAVVGGLVTPTYDPAPPRVAVTETVLKRGDTLQAALARSQLGRSDAAAIIAALSREVDLRRVHPGERLFVTRAPDGQLVEVTYRRTPAERHEAYLDGDAWRARKVLTPPERLISAVTGVLAGSLFESMDRLNEGPALTAKFVNLFEWDFDFAADALPGDRFRLLVEKQHIGGEFIGYGDILVAQYLSAGKPRLTAATFQAALGKTDYFDAEGRSIRKMFLRAPLDFTRITSGYSHARVHPVLGGVRPHLAIDYAAPIGTPVRAVADGVVEAAGWKGGNGLSITLRHARRYKTVYNHLAAVTVRPGERVRQRQVIGRVGATGLSTGPHLDYRVIKRGRYVNPLDERFIPGAPVPPAQRTAFRRHLDTLLDRLDAEAPFAEPIDRARARPHAPRDGRPEDP